MSSVIIAILLKDLLLKLLIKAVPYHTGQNGSSQQGRFSYWLFYEISFDYNMKESQRFIWTSNYILLKNTVF